MVELPLKAFCLMGSNGNDKIELIINEVFYGSTSYRGGIDFCGSLTICAGVYRVHSENFFSSTGMMRSLLESLLSCYNSLMGAVEYKDMFEDDLYFILKMRKLGRATIEGHFQEYPHLPSKLIFQMETDQTCILSAISDLKKIQKQFGV